MIRVVLVDDQSFVHESISSLLKSTADISLVGEAYHASDVAALCRVSRPDVVLMDVVMPGTTGSEVTRAVISEFPSLKVLGLSSYQDTDNILTMLENGAVGYVIKSTASRDLLSTIRAVHDGKSVFSPEIVRALIARPSIAAVEFGLTDRERLVLTRLAHGHTEKQIAQSLSISKPTVRFHLNNILLKLGVETRSQALVLAAKNNLI